MAMEDIMVNGVTEILKPLISLIARQITLAWGVKDDLRKLKETLESIQALISDAEKKQVDDASVRLWLRRLKDVVYDAEDVMDEFSYGTMRLSERKVRAFLSSSHPLVFRFKMASKIRDIKVKLDEIHEDSKRYTLQNTSSDISATQETQIREQRNRLTSSEVDESLVLGREDAKSNIINKLMDNSSSSSSRVSSGQGNISYLSVVGMGGLGKTTIAQMVYKDVSIVRNFDLRAWVCVSDNFDVHKILKDIVESITETKYDDPSNIEALVKHFKKKLIGKKYLLVLDDLWHEEDDEDLAKLKQYLAYGSAGSKVMVTTRKHRVARVVGGEVYDLQKLSDDVCWSIMEKKILSRGGAVLTKEMAATGRKVAKKCDGLPLAVNFLGSLMSSKFEENYWLSILNDNHLWDTPETKRIISILKLSYNNLPSHLKQCFSYCCIFPKDWVINRETLIHLWMAEGFLSPSDEVNNRLVEDIGNDYFEHLFWNSFFQDVVRDELGGIETCKIHDLVHDLAMTVVERSEVAFVKARDVKEDSQVRRMGLLFDEMDPALEVLQNPTKLRTVLALNYASRSVKVDWFFRYKRLHVLCMLLGRTRLSSSFPKYKHLRYLNISGCRIDSKQNWFLNMSNCIIDSKQDLSLNRFYSLQTLVLYGCKNVSSLLTKVGSLKLLRHLDISWSDVKFQPDSVVSLTNLQKLNLQGCNLLEGLPENIGLLKHLSGLDISYTGISELPDSLTCIVNLKTLKFDNCGLLDRLPRELGALTRLRCLDLSWTSIKVLPESCIRNLGNLEMMKLGDKCELPKEIKNWPKLRIFTHEREDDVMPRGIDMLPCLKTLKHYNVRKVNDSGIEELSGFNSLEVLGIRNLENVRGGTQGAERAKLKDKEHLRELELYWGLAYDEDRSWTDSWVSEGLQPHPNLKKLSVRGFAGAKLPKWIGSSNCLPNLVELNLFNLDNCEKLPALGMLPYLRVLRIWEMKSVKCLGEELYFQDENEEESSGSSSNTTKRFSFFPSLVELIISNLENLEEWVAPPLSSSCFPSLDSLGIFGCRRLGTTPITSIPSLKKLQLHDTDENTVNLLLKEGREGCLTSLTSINIGFSPDLMYLPPLGVLLQHKTPNLQELEISYCSNLQGFRDDNDDLNNNSSFRKLRFEKCPVLMSLPDLRLCTSLKELIIYGCSKLNKESVPYDLKKSLTFLDTLGVDFIQRDKGGPDVSGVFDLINLMDE